MMYVVLSAVTFGVSNLLISLWEKSGALLGFKNRDRRPDQSEETSSGASVSACFNLANSQCAKG
jgi:hypothetical protein